MGDIHVLDGTYQSQQSAIFKRYVLHFPIAASLQVVTAAEDPDLIAFNSEVPDITAGELTSIRAGQVVERVITDKYHTWDNPETVLARIRSVYAGLFLDVETDYARRYEYYLDIRSAS